MELGAKEPFLALKRAMEWADGQEISIQASCFGLRLHVWIWCLNDMTQSWRCSRKYFFKLAVLSPPTGPLAGRHLFRVISSATAFHNLIRDQKSPERGPPRTPPECLTLLSEPVK